MSDNSGGSNEPLPEDNTLFKTAFLLGVSGISVLSGFGYAVGASRKSDPTSFDKGLTKLQRTHAAGSSLAVKALGWGSLFAFVGVGSICGIIWKASGAQNIGHFREIVGNVLPRIAKNDPPQSKTEFSSISDLWQYLIDEDERKEKDKNETSCNNT